jgi:hypothetical protein
MNSTIGKLVASLAVSGALALAGLLPAHAAPAGPSLQVPFLGAYAGSFTFTDDSHLTLSGSGDSTYLGHGTSSGHIAFLGPATCAGGFKIHDDETLTGAGGDQLAFSVDDQACPTATAGVYQIQANYTVTGGAGRFAGVSGKGVAICFGDFNKDTFRFAMAGTVSAPLGRH